MWDLKGVGQQCDTISCATLLSLVALLQSLNKKDIAEVKAYGRPPVLVETVMQAVMILKGCDPSWAEAKRQLGKSPGSKPPPLSP